MYLIVSSYWNKVFCFFLHVIYNDQVLWRNALADTHFIKSRHKYKDVWQKHKQTETGHGISPGGQSLIGTLGVQKAGLGQNTGK